MKIPLYQIDAFADRPFTGNPAAVCQVEGDRVLLFGRATLFLRGEIEL